MPYIPKSVREGTSEKSNPAIDKDGLFVPKSERPPEPVSHETPLEDKKKGSTPVTDTGISDQKPTKHSAFPSVDFEVDDVDSFVKSRGIPALWQQSFICPCIDPVTHQPNPTCPICHGTYRGYLPAIKDTWVAIQSQNRGTKRTEEFGNLDLGTAEATFRAETNINVMDRLTLPDITTRQNYVFTATEDNFDSGYYIPYEVKGILYIVAYKDNDFRELIEDHDFLYKKDNFKLFLINKKLIGYTISMILNVTIRYIITNIVRDARYQFNSVSKKVQKLPKLATLKRESVLINNMPLTPKSTDELQTEANNSNALSEEGIRLLQEENSSGFGLSGI